MTDNELREVVRRVREDIVTAVHAAKPGLPPAKRRLNAADTASPAYVFERGE